MASHKTNQTITLEDGRTLGFAEHGDPGGTPIFYFHGSAGSRLEHPTDESVLREVGVWLISTDRPGYGLSDFQPGRKLLDWPDDVVQLADHLGIDQFYVLGASAGGPHALACAYRLPERVVAGALAAGLAPVNRLGAHNDLPFSSQALMFAVRYVPGLTGVFRRMARNTVLGDVEQIMRQFVSSVSEADREVLHSGKNLEMVVYSIREGYRSGWQGIARDDAIIMQDWRFDIADISDAVRIDIWQGDLDQNVPLHAAEYMRDRIPNTRTTILSGEGHLFLFKRWGEVLQALVTEQGMSALSTTGHWSDVQQEGDRNEIVSVAGTL